MTYACILMKAIANQGRDDPQSVDTVAVKNQDPHQIPRRRATRASHHNVDALFCVTSYYAGWTLEKRQHRRTLAKEVRLLASFAAKATGTRLAGSIERAKAGTKLTLTPVALMSLLGQSSPNIASIILRAHQMRFFRYCIGFN